MFSCVKKIFGKQINSLSRPKDTIDDLVVIREKKTQCKEENYKSIPVVAQHNIKRSNHSSDKNGTLPE